MISNGVSIYLGIDGTENIQEYSYEGSYFREIPGYNIPTFYHQPKYIYSNTATDPTPKFNRAYQPFQRKPGCWSKASIWIIEPRNEIDLKGEPYFYLDLDTLNCIDELQPYRDNEYSTIHSQNAGKLSASFSKLPITISDDVAYGRGSSVSKVFYPPASRLHRVKIKIRFHNGRPVNFGVQPFSLVLEIVCKGNQIELARK